MPSYSTAVGRLLLLGYLSALATAQDNNPCKSFGVDFQNNGTYFQNINSADPFTFVQYFEGCQADSSQNILVDPTGDQVQCTDTNLTPPDVNMLSTCPTLKDQLFSGEWSIIVMSNNGQAQPIAYQRDFSLIVGTQTTVTITPTITNLVTFTPIVTSTSTRTDTAQATAKASTITTPSATITPTVTVTPQAVKVTTTKPLWVVTLTSINIQPTLKTVTSTETCRAAPTGVLDFLAEIFPTIPGVTAKAMATPTGKSKRRPSRMEGFENFFNKREFLEKRKANLAHVKRAPDAMTTTVTDTNTADYKTTTKTITASAVTSVVGAVATITSTLTPPPVVVVAGKTTAKASTVTAATPTLTVTVNPFISYTWITQYLGSTITVTSKVLPASSVVAACTKSGGAMY